MAQDINRLKVVLAEEKRTNKWLSEQVGKDSSIVSKWCSNTMQPNLEHWWPSQKYLMWMLRICCGQ